MKNKSYFWGTFFILSAVLLILNALGLLAGVSIVSLILTLLLIPLIVKSIRYASFSGVLFPLAVIAILFDKQLGIEKLTPWPVLGIALFLSIGLSLLFPKRHNGIISTAILTLFRKTSLITSAAMFQTKAKLISAQSSAAA